MKTLKLLLLLLITTGPLAAQDIVADLIGKGLYDVRKDAQKMLDQPKTKDTVIAAPAFDYTIVSRQVPAKFRIDTIRPAKVTNEQLTKLYHGYAKLGFGNYSTILADASYASTRSKSGAWGIGLGSLTSGTGPKDVQGFAGYGQQHFDLFGKKFYKHHTFGGDFGFTRDVVHYYGNLSGNDSLSKDAIRQRFVGWGGGGRLISHYVDSTQINYDLSLRYFNYADRFGSNENNFKISGTGGRYLNTEKLSLDFGIDYDRGKSVSDTVNNTIIQLQPMFRAGGGAKKFSVAIGMGMYVDAGAESRVYFYPQFEASYDIVNHIIIPYAGMGGYLERNGFRSLTDVNPFLLSSTSVTARNTQYKNLIYIGLKGSISAEISYNIKASHHERRDMPLFVNTLPSQDFYQMHFATIYDTVDVTGVSGDIGYQKGEKLRISAHGEFFEYKPKNESKAWHTPALRMGVSASYNIQDKILARFDLFYIDKQYAKLVTPDGLTAPLLLNRLIDVNVGLEYRYSKFLSAFLSAQNLAGQRYFRWNAYPTQKFNVLGGVTYSF